MIKLRYQRKSENLFEDPAVAKAIKTLRITLPDYELHDCGKEFLKFERLKELYVHSDVEFKSLLPTELGALKSLEKLTILNFDYREFPNWILGLKNLKSLTFRSNGVDTIPEEIGQLKLLSCLRIENCCVKDLPLALRELHELKQLSLSDNKYLERINLDCLPKNLRVLNLVMTQVSEDHLLTIKKRFPSLTLNKFVK